MRGSLIAIVFSFVVFTACGSGSVRPDICDGTNPNGCPAASQANYPTAEFVACGKAWHGLGTCFVKRGELLDSVGLEIQGYSRGTVRLVSQDCFIDETLRYENSQRVRMGLSGIADQSCLLSFVITPEFDPNQAEGVIIRSFKGHLWVGVREQEDVSIEFISKIPEGGDAEIRVPVGTPGLHRVVFRGCDIGFDKCIESKDGMIGIHLSEIGPKPGMKRCILQGGIEDGGQNKFITWMIWGYDKKFVPLPIPVVEFDKNKINIIGDPNVSVVSLDEEWRLKNIARFKFDPMTPHIVRLLTVGGRSVFGIWNIDRRSFEWMQ